MYHIALNFFVRKNFHRLTLQNIDFDHIHTLVCVPTVLASNTYTLVAEKPSLKHKYTHTGQYIAENTINAHIHTGS